MKTKILLTLLMLSLGSCATSEEVVINTDRWLARLEAVADNISVLSENKNTRKVAEQVTTLIKIVRSGELTSIQQAIDKVRDLKPLLITTLKEEGIDNDTILIIVSGLDIALLGLEDTL